MNTKIILASTFLLMSFALIKAVPCGTATGSAGLVLNVGILPGNLPYSDIVAGQPVGFDVLLVIRVAKLLGYDTVNFIGYASGAVAEAALIAGDIDIYANSAEFPEIPPTNFIGIVTDISELYRANEVNGWILNTTCCDLAEQIQAAINQVVASGGYAQILQQLRLANQTAGMVLGQPYTGNQPVPVLFQPFPFASDEIGTIPAICSPTGPNFVVNLPRTNCISAFLQSNCLLTITFTGATGQSLG